MSPEARPLLHVLGLLRLIKSEKGDLASLTAFMLIQRWARPAEDESLFLRVAVYVQEECDAAIAFVRGCEMTDEQKLGVIETISKVRQAFGIEHIRNGLQSYLPQLDASISQLSFLTTSYGLGNGKSPPEAEELVHSIEEMMQTIEELNLDERVATTAKKHLHILATLLRNIEVMGVDAAMAAYLELLIRLRRELETAPPETQNKFKKLWPEVERWAGRLAIIEKAVETGGALLHKAEGAVQLLLSSLN